MRSFPLGRLGPVMILAAASPSFAQSPAQTPPQGSAQTAPATADPAPPDEGAMNEVTVTGFRASLESAQSIKRNSVQVVDSVVAEDIGKLPDLSVAETSARIPGIQVIRVAGEASRVLVRG